MIRNNANNKLFIYSKLKVDIMKKKKIYEVYPELVKYFKNKSDAYTYLPRSDKRVIVKCPECGHEHEMIIHNLTRRHYKCPVCGDGNSYPEKIMLALLDQLGIEYIYHLNKKKFAWCEKYIYDFYIPDLNIIIETDGLQHYSGGFKKNVEEYEKNDRIKEEIAIKNGINKVIHIDCSNRDLIILKENIINNLKNFFDLTKINWEECVHIASKSKVYEICKFWEKEKENKNAAEIAKELGVKRGTLVRYLHKGTEAGFCVYDGKKERRRAAKKGGKRIKEIRTREIDVYDKDDNFLMSFSSAKELSKNSKEIFGIEFTYQGIIYCCNGTNKTHNGYKFKYRRI